MSSPKHPHQGLEGGGAQNSLEPGEERAMDEIMKLRFDYAWKWFDFHAKQRMQLFNFFVIITGVLATAFATAYDKDLHYVSLAVCLLGSIAAIGFIVFDIRSRELTRYAEDVLDKLEQDWLFPGAASTTEDQVPHGLMRREVANKMREGMAGERGWRNFRKIKVWVRAIEGLVAIAFMIGLIVTVADMRSPEVPSAPAPGLESSRDAPRSPSQGQSMDEVRPTEPRATEVEAGSVSDADSSIEE